jgi:hypothetical protein
MHSDATTVTEYLASLPEDRRRAMKAVRTVIRANLPKGLVEAMNWGMIVYEVPLKACPDTYNGQPLAYAALASQKQYMSVYLMGIYGSDELRADFERSYRASGKRMDIGKACVRFRTLEDLPLDVVANAIGALTIEEFIAMHEQSASLRKARSRRNRSAEAS